MNITKTLENNSRVVLILISIIVIGIIVVLVVKLLHDKPSEPISSECSEIGGAVLAQTQEHKLSLILDWEKSNCEKPICLQHTKEFLQPSAIDREVKFCPDFPELKNASCYQCKDKCLSFDDLKLKMEDEKPMFCRKRVIVDCCLISAMGKLNNNCGDNGNYECFHNIFGVTEKEPICKCKDGFKGDRCETENKFYSKCKCYDDVLMLRMKDEDELKECGDTIESGVNVCSTSILRDNGAFKCVCNTTDPSSDN